MTGFEFCAFAFEIEMKLNQGCAMGMDGSLDDAWLDRMVRPSDT